MVRYPETNYNYNDGNENHGHIIDFKDFDWKQATEDDIMRFGKTLDDLERGIPGPEMPYLMTALNSITYPKDREMTIVETGMFYGTSTRTWIAWTLKNGGKVYTAEVVIMEDFKKKMEDAGYWQYVNIIGNSMECEWDKPIDFLFIDSNHYFVYAWGEYEKFSKYLVPGAIVGWHDTMTNTDGVRPAIERAKEEDTLEFICSQEVHCGIEFYRFIKKGK